MMNMITHLLFLVSLLSPSIINAAAADPAYKAKEHILLSCGSKNPMLKSTGDGQIWVGDATTNLSPDINVAGLSFPAIAQKPDTSRNPAPDYLFARIINSKFSYIFPLSAGQKILRLYFNPTTYTNSLKVSETFDATKFYFDVTANKYTLLKNFGPYDTIENSWRPAWVQKPTHIVKEFIINVQQSESLNVTFTPSQNSSAFINGIEVVSVPENLYMGSHDLNKRSIRFVNSNTSQFDIDQTNTAFETMNRAVMGGPKIAPVDDTGMFREWAKDNDFLISWIKGNTTSNDSISLNYTPETPDYSAPAAVYKTARNMIGEDPSKALIWNFRVDSGFIYLFRLHFCEFTPSQVFRAGQRAFKVFVDDIKAEAVDVIYYAGGTGIPIMRDYAVLITNDNVGSGFKKHDLELSVSPDRDSQPQYLDAFVNGVELFKLSAADGNLAGGVNA